MLRCCRCRRALRGTVNNHGLTVCGGCGALQFVRLEDRGALVQVSLPLAGTETR